jgi:hypothetical protein
MGKDELIRVLFESWTGSLSELTILVCDVSGKIGRREGCKNNLLPDY